MSLPGALAAEPEAHDDAGAEALARAKLVEAANPVHPPQPRVSALTVLVMTVIMACAAGLGALPFFVIQSLSPTLGAIATATACGVMFAASFDLIHEGSVSSLASRTARSAPFLGVIAGAVFIQWMEDRMQDVKEIRFADLRGAPARRAAMMVGIMAAHALGEGCGVGVSFSGPRGWTSGLLTTLAIGVHNIPEGLATATVLASQGLRPGAVLFWSIASCMPQPLVALPSYLFVNTFAFLLPFALGFAAGCMIWMVIAELLPGRAGLGDERRGFRMLFEANWGGPANDAIALGEGELSGPVLASARLLRGGRDAGSPPAFPAAPLGTIVLPAAELTFPALTTGCTAILVALGAASLVSAAKLPQPLRGRRAGGGAALALLRQVLGLPDAAGQGGGVPALHTLSAAAAAPGRAPGGSKKPNLAAPILAAALVATGATALTLVPAGWNWAGAILLQRSASFLLVPVAIAVLAPCAALGATLGASLGPRPGAVLAGSIVTGLAAACGVVAMAVTLRRYPVDSAADAKVIMALWRYPLGLADTVASCTAGAAVMAGVFLVGNGVLLSPSRARGGAALGAVLLLGLAGLQQLLCAVSPYCLALDPTAQPAA
ncbi:hypothetical protein QBZ16_003925 [Prototheca wickerhamii]|uniref:Zinc transporter n=1 Tax=Prototheca wickerhamii TaxID=3111 RepID=A0AAD9ILA0_PROWI|nr:hypothetical protein QBZ16_003925 [Prototheca wickerhamii]